LRRWFLTLRTQVGDALTSGWDRETTLTRVAERMQQLAPRGMEERLPNTIGQVFDELSRTA
jgi:hypothetical protein